MTGTLIAPRTAAAPGTGLSRWTPIAAFLAATQVALGVRWISGLYRYVSSPDVFQSDFTAFYTAWRMTIEGRSHALYDLAAQQQTQETVRGMRLGPTTLLAYVNPPYAALPMTPLGWMPFRVAYVTWLILQLGLLALAAQALLAGVAAVWTRTERALLMVTVVTSVATLTSLSLGAFALLALLAAVKLTMAIRWGRTRHAGAWLVLLAVKPQLAVLAVVALAGLRCWAILRDAALIAAVAAAASTIVCGAGIWGAWLRLLRTFGSAEGLYGVDAHYMWNLRGALVRAGRFSSGTSSRIATAVLIISALMVLAAGTRAHDRASRWNRVDPGMAMAALIALSVLTATHCNRQDTAVLLLAGALVHHHFRSTPNGPAVGCALMGCWLLAWAVGNSYDGPALHPVTVMAAAMVLFGGLSRRRTVQATPDGGRSETVDIESGGPRA